MSNPRGKKIVKILLLGDGAVGKTSLRKEYTGKGYEEKYSMTMGAEFSILRADDAIIQIYDLAGQVNFKPVRSNYYRGSQGAILVFDVTKRASYKSLDAWIQELNMQVSKDIPLIVVGNKIDLRDEKNEEVSSQEIKDWIAHLELTYDAPILYLETSVVDHYQVFEVFKNLIDMIDGVNVKELAPIKEFGHIGEHQDISRSDPEGSQPNNVSDEGSLSQEYTDPSQPLTSASSDENRIKSNTSESLYITQSDDVIITEPEPDKKKISTIPSIEKSDDIHLSDGTDEETSPDTDEKLTNVDNEVISKIEGEVDQKKLEKTISTIINPEIDSVPTSVNDNNGQTTSKSDITGDENETKLRSDLSTITNVSSENGKNKFSKRLLRGELSLKSSKFGKKKAWKKKYRNDKSKSDKKKFY